MRIEDIFGHHESWVIYINIKDRPADDINCAGVFDDYKYYTYFNRRL